MHAVADGMDASWEERKATIEALAKGGADFAAKTPDGDNLARLVADEAPRDCKRRIMNLVLGLASRRGIELMW